MARLLLRDLTPGTTYKIQLRAVGEDSVSEWSPLYSITATADNVAPTVPDWAVSNPWVTSGDTFVATWQAINTALPQNSDFSHYQITFTAGVQSFTVNTTNTNYVLTFEENRARFGTPQATVLSKVRAVDATGNASSYNSELSATNALPDAPTSVDAEAIQDGIKISWTNSTSDDVIGYNIYIGTSPNPTTKVAFTNSNPYTYTSLTFVQQYVRVRAVDKFGQESAYSNEDSATPESPFVFDTNAPAAPGSFVVTITNENTAAVITRQIATATWTHPGESDLAGFHFRFKKTTDSTWTAFDIEPEARSFAVALPQAFANYNFEIRAYDLYTNRSAWVSDSDQVTSYSPPTFLTSLVIGSGGYIESSSFGSGVGFRIDDDSITIHNGAINGQAITTGVIRSNEPALDEAGNPIVGEYAWQIDLEGDAVFGDVKVRGNMVVGTAAGPTTSIIQSGNYVSGNTGWAIRSDGSAEFRQLASQSIVGEDVIIDGTLSLNKIKPGSLSAEIRLDTGSIAAYGLLGEKVSFGGAGFESLGAFAVEITNSSLTSNVATLTTSVDHGFTAGNPVRIEGCGTPYDGDWIIASVGSNTFTVNITNANVSSSPEVGSAKSISNNPAVSRPTLVNFPTDGARPNIISGLLTAESLSVSSGASLRGDSEIEYSAKLYIASALQAPKKAPVVTSDYNELQLPTEYQDGIRGGMTIGHDGNYYVINNGDGTVRKFNPTTGAYISDFITGLTTAITSIFYSSVTSRYYLLRLNYVSSTQVSNSVEVRDTSGTLITTTLALRTFSPSVLVTPDAGRPAYVDATYNTIGWDHVNSRLLYSFYDFTNSRVEVRRYLMSSGNPTTLDTTITLTSSDEYYSIAYVGLGTFDFGGSRIVLKPINGWWRTFDTAGTYQGSSEAWPDANNEYVIAGLWDVTNSQFKDLSWTFNVRTYYGSAHYWTSGVNIHWVGYSWYDANATVYTVTNKELTSNVATLTTSVTHALTIGGEVTVTGVDSTFNGTYVVTAKTATTFSYAKTASNVSSTASGGNATGNTHETQLSPLQSFSLPKRSRMNVTVDKIPYDSASSDSPNNAKVYVYNTRQETKPASTGSNWKRRGLIATPSLSTFIDLNASPPSDEPKSTNQFVNVGLSPAEIRSTSGLSYWKGDDTANFYRLSVSGTATASPGAGVLPPLRIVNTSSSSEMRVDNNQIMSVDSSGNPVTLSINQDSLGDGPVNIRGMIKAGTKASGTITADTDKTLSVTFGTPFPSSGPEPEITCTPRGVNSQANPITWSVNNISKSGFDIIVRRGTTTQFDMSWIAVATTAS